MVIKSSDRNPFSFGKLSDKGVLNRSPLYGDDFVREQFSDNNFQYVVDNIIDMFGYAQGTVKVSVNDNDVANIWRDFNQNNIVDAGEISMEFVMNAYINIYQRTSVYGKNFMYINAKNYGYPVIWGVAAHEVGHLISTHALSVIEQKIVNGSPALVLTQQLNTYWSELCADYLSGVVLAKATPPMDCTPLEKMLGSSAGSSSHPDGYLRSLAIRWGHMWGTNNPRNVTDTWISGTDAQRELLVSFFKGFYTEVYSKLAPEVRARLVPLPNYLLEPCNFVLSYI